MNTLGYFQDNTDISYPCPPLLVSFTAKVIPYAAIGLCTTDVGDDKGIAATMDRLLTKEYSNDMRAGTGGNYLLELYLTGGLVAIILGSLLFGFSCRRFVELTGHRSLFAGIWAECLSRALFAPRGNLGYVYERIPSLLLATAAVIVLSWSFRKLRTPPLIPNT
jgi:O-antigen polysaccharide polymerase Wzy